MSVVYILAHFDDEYGALPLIWQARRDGLDQHFLYMADYREAAMAARRLAETRGFLRAQGVSADAVQHLGAGTGAFDQSVWRTLDVLWPKLRAATGALGAIDHIVVPAFEGGHMDHDACAAMGARLGRELAVAVRQFSLYNGQGIGAPWLRGATPLAQNGPVNRASLSLAEWLRWMAAVRWFPSQLYAWSGIWPAMFWSFAQRGFGWQALAPGRTDERPHEGLLYYERAFRTPYAAVRAALDAFSRGSSAT